MTVRCCTLEIDGDELMIAERDGALVAVEFGGDRAAMLRTVAGPGGGARLAWTDGTDSPARRQLAEYFAGRRREFELPLAPRGTPFQLEVWAALRTIPFGSTCSYADIAARIGRPNAVRAVGAANGRNPIAIIVPCHRVIGRDGSLTGYAGGLDRKRRLLQHERTVPGPKPTCGF